MQTVASKMTALECWQEMRPELSKEITRQQDAGGVIYAVRHAILQTEQNILASQSDDVLRQQLGVLFALLKNSISLLNVPVSSTTWTAASRRNERKPGRGFPFMLAAGMALLATGFWGYAKGDLLGWVLPLCTLVLAVIALVISRRERKEQPETGGPQLKTTHTFDAEQLLGAVEAQLTMIDRCANDFAYLNQSLRTPAGGSGGQNLEAVSELLETIYAYDDELRQQADDAIRQLLGDMGLELLDYSPEHQKLFNQLPSKNMTRTLCPALLSAEDHKLLRRGTAAVSMDAA